LRLLCVLQTASVHSLPTIAQTQCYGIGGGIDIDRKDNSPQRGGTWEYDNTKYQPPLYHNGLQICDGLDLEAKTFT